MADERDTVATKAPGRLPRGHCPKCGRDVALRRGGELREHRRDEGTRNPLCAASGLTPLAVENLLRAGERMSNFR